MTARPSPAPGDVPELRETRLERERRLEELTAAEKQADWVIDLGPEAGELGGFLVFQGTPEALVDRKQGVTWPFLAETLAAETARA